jgi:hypothetical protein
VIQWQAAGAIERAFIHGTAILHQREVKEMVNQNVNEQETKFIKPAEDLLSISPSVHGRLIRSQVD